MANPVIINPTLTLAGQAAAFNASNDGLELKITHVTFGTAHYDPTGNEVALVAPVGSPVAVAGASRPTPYQIRMVSSWHEDVGQVAIGEIGFWAEDTLVFVWSKADGTTASYKTDGVAYVLFNDLAFSSVPANSINFTIDPNESVALAALAAHEGANNAHPQYVLRAKFPDYQGHLWGDVTGTADAIALTLPAIVDLTQYTKGNRFTFKATATNTGDTTINVDGVGPVQVLKTGGVALTAGSIIAGGVYDVYYDGAKFQLTAGAGFASAEATEAEVTALTATDSTSWLSVRRLIKALSYFAKLASPVFTGNPTTPTPATGDNDLSVVNSEFVRTAVHGSTFIDVSGAGTLALTAAQTGTGTLTLFGALTGNRTIVVPTVQTRLQVVNSTTGAFSLTVKTAAGVGVAVTQGASTLLFVTGANTVAQQQSDFDSIAMTGNPTTPTPAAGDNDKSVANTEFVQRAKGGYRGFTALTAAAALTVADIGNLVSVNGTFTVTLPASNLVNRGEAIHFRNVGDGAVTVACAGADIIDAGGIALANITLQPGASLELVNAGGTNWWASGSAQLQYSTVRESFGGVIGEVRNGRMSVTAPSLTATYKADELLVMAPYGGLHRLVGVNKSINLSTVGAGGMGVAGGAPINGWLCIYVVYNPDTKAMALVGVNGTPAVLSEKCPPASLPAGYTASALVAVVPINASGQFPVLEVVDREVMTYKSIYGGLVATLTAMSLSASVPPNAKSINMNAASTVNAAGQCTVVAAGTAAGSANPGFTTYVGQSTASGQNVTFTFRDVPLFTPQYIWLQATGPLVTTQFNCYGYKF